MRVLHITSHLNPGGITTYACGLARALKSKSHDVIIASGPGTLQEDLEKAGISIWNLPFATSAEFSPKVMGGALKLSGMLAKNPVDVIHAHTRVGQVVAGYVSRRNKIPYVTTWHGFFRNRLSRRMFPCTGDLTIAISEPVARHLQNDFGVDKSRIRLIPNGVDVSYFQRPLDIVEVASFRAEMGLKPGSPVIGTVSRLVPSKGVDQLIRSLPIIRQNIPNAQLLIVGEGSHRSELENLAERLGVASGVCFAGSVADVKTALSVMRVFVFLPADKEGFGLSLLEAMANSLPVVAIRQGGGANWLLDETKTAIEVEPQDTKKLGLAVVRLLADPQEAKSLGERSLEVVKQKYDFESVVEKVEQVYKEAVKK